MTSRSSRSRTPPPSRDVNPNDVMRDRSRSREEDDVNRQLIHECTTGYSPRSSQRVRTLLGLKADPNSTTALGRPALSLASEPFCVTKVRLLCAAKADPNVLTPTNEPVLLTAIRRGTHSSIIPLLLDAKANLAAITELRETPLHLAAKHWDRRWVGMLLACKAAVDPKDDCKATPLHVAVGHGNTKTAQTLLEAKAAINHPDCNGELPLHCAAANAKDTKESMNAMFFDGDRVNEELVRQLLHSKADVDATNGDGKTPLEVASTEAVRKQLANAQE
jgi:ankyrin repeat protein